MIACWFVVMLQRLHIGRSFFHWVLKRDAFGIMIGTPPIGGVRVGEDLEMVNVPDFLAGVDVNPNRFIG